MLASTSLAPVRMCALVLALAASGCALWGIPRVPREVGEPWAKHWNGRIESAPTPFQHPCATLEFSAWAEGFLETCRPYWDDQEGECVHRKNWVRARSAQCKRWEAYLLRNHNRQVRDDTSPEPSMRAEY